VTVLTSVLPALFSLKEASADSFLPVLQQQMERLFAGGVFERRRDFSCPGSPGPRSRYSGRRKCLVPDWIGGSGLNTAIGGL
jgi:hypothetical protein